MYLKNEVAMLFLLTQLLQTTQKQEQSFLMVSHNTAQTLHLPVTVH